MEYATTGGLMLSACTGDTLLEGVISPEPRDCFVGQLAGRNGTHVVVQNRFNRDSILVYSTLHEKYMEVTKEEIEKRVVKSENVGPDTEARAVHIPNEE